MLARALYQTARLRNRVGSVPAPGKKEGRGAAVYEEKERREDERPRKQEVGEMTRKPLKPGQKVWVKKLIDCLLAEP